MFGQFGWVPEPGLDGVVGEALVDGDALSDGVALVSGAGLAEGEVAA